MGDLVLLTAVRHGNTQPDKPHHSAATHQLDPTLTELHSKLTVSRQISTLLGINCPSVQRRRELTECHRATIAARVEQEAVEAVLAEPETDVGRVVLRSRPGTRTVRRALGLLQPHVCPGILELLCDLLDRSDITHTPSV